MVAHVHTTATKWFFRHSQSTTNLRADGLGGDDERVLWHVPRPVDLAIVVHLLDDVHLAS